MAHLSISLLGPFQATLDGEPIGEFESNKARALLAVLAVESGRVHRREQLADLLWPETAGRGSLSNLRYTLSNLRQAVGDREASPSFLIISRDTLQFNAASDHSLDVDTFRELIGPGWQGREESDCLEQALALFRGSFLEGLSVRDSLPFEEWALFKREEFGRQVMATLQRLATIYERRGQYDRAIVHTRRQLELEPWQEEAHRHLMRLLALDGQRSAALAQYRTCCEQLARELDVAPTAETVALYESIRQGTLAQTKEHWPTSGPDSSAQVHPRPPQGLASPFVAREEEMARLNRVLDAVLAGQGQVVFVTGEAGSGKTALMHEFARQAMAAHADVVVATGTCTTQSGAGDPYVPFVDILQMLAGDIEAKRASGSITPAHAKRLWSLLPQTVQALLDTGPDLIDLLIPGPPLAARVATHAPWPGGPKAAAAIVARLEEVVEQRASAPAGPMTVARTGLFAQTTKLLQTLAVGHTLILVIDDLQWIDAGSVELLFHLGHRLSGSRILVVAAYRPGSVALGRNGERHPLESLVNELQREFGNQPIDLAQADGRRFVDAYVDSEPNRLGVTFRDTLYNHTRGQALFTVELVRGLQKRGDLVQDEGGRWIEGAALDWQRMPVRVEAVIAEHIERLPAQLRDLLKVACVEGQEFTAEVVARVLGLPEAETLRWLSGDLSKQHDMVRPASVQRLVSRTSSDPTRGDQRLSRYRFRHYLFQMYLYQHLDPVERAGLHEAVGRALEALYEGHTVERETITPQLAQHYEVAAMTDSAVDCYIEAGRRAFRMSATEEAIAHLQKGLILLDSELEGQAGPDRHDGQGAADRDRRELDLQLALVDPLLTARGWGGKEQAAALMRAYQLAERLDEIDRLLPVLLSVAYLSIGRGEFYKALDLSEEVLHLAESAGEPFYIAMSHQRLGTSYMFLGELVLARDHLERALALAENRPPGSTFSAWLWTRDIAVPALTWLPYTLWVLGYPDQAQARSDEAIAKAESLNHIPSLAATLTAAGSALYLLCREAAMAGVHTARVLHLAEDQDLKTFEVIEAIHRGYERVEQGQIAAGIEEMRSGLADLEGLGQMATRPRQLTLLAEAYLRAGEVVPGLAVLDDAQLLVDRTGAAVAQPELIRLRGEFSLLEAGDDGRLRAGSAETYLQQAIEVAHMQQAKSWELRAAMSLSRLLQQQGRVLQAREVLSGPLGWFTEGFGTPDLSEAAALFRQLEGS